MTLKMAITVEIITVMVTKYNLHMYIIPDQTVPELWHPMNRQSATKWKVLQLQLLHSSLLQQDSEMQQS